MNRTAQQGPKRPSLMHQLQLPHMPERRRGSGGWITNVLSAWKRIWNELGIGRGGH